MITDFDLRPLIGPLKLWYEANARTLRWRTDPSPYYVWISEIMLQQTRVEAVKTYFDRFVAELPDIRALAECPEDRYLKLWEGLGYYNRVRNLHAAAVQIMTEHAGQIPDDYETLLSLKGIGSYTAGAIASLAYDKPVPAVDGNVFRVLSRVTADDTDITLQSFRTCVEKELRNLMKEVCPKQIRPGVFNQALMELGALVCIPNGQPHCKDCPWMAFCLARKEGKTGYLPVKKKAKARRVENKTVFLLHDGQSIAIRKRAPKGLLAGLYEFPNYPGHLSEKETLTFVRNMGYTPLRIKRLVDSIHIFSHVEWHMIAYRIIVEEDAFATEEQRQKARKEHLLFVNADEQKQSYAVPSAFAAYKDG